MSAIAGIRPRDRIDFPAAALLVLLCAGWGVQQVAVKVGITGGLAPVLQAGLRSAVSTVLLFGWVAARGEWREMLRRDGSLGLGLVIAALFAAEFLFLYPGLARTSASRAVLLLYTAPFFVAAGAHLFIPGERMRMRQVAGLLLAFGGMALAVTDSVLARAPGGTTVIGDALVLTGAALWGATTVVIKATRLARIRVSKILLYQIAGSAPILLGFSALLGESWDLPAVTTTGWLAFAYQAVGISFASYLAWFWMIAHYPASRVSAFTFLTPLFGMIAGAVMLGEHVTALLVLALLCVIGGLKLVNARS